jgi:hypothetical protein
MKKNDAKVQDVYLPELLTGPVELGPVQNRHLLAAGVKGELRLRLVSLAQPSDAKDWEEHRSKLGTAAVMCPECEGDNDAPCRTCGGKGMVNRVQWDEWFFATKSCRNYRKDCWLKCTEPRCSYDSGHAMQMTIALALESFSAKLKKWVNAGANARAPVSRWNGTPTKWPACLRRWLESLEIFRTLDFRELHAMRRGVSHDIMTEEGLPHSLVPQA